MKPGVVDLIVMSWVAWGVRRGRNRGLGQELLGALSLAIFLFTGCGVYRWADRVLEGVGHVTGQTIGVLGFLGLAGAAIASVRNLHRFVQDWSDRRYKPDQLKFGGAIFGSVRTFLLACVVLLVLAHWPLHALTRPVAESSMLGRSLTKWVLPVYQKTHGAL